MTLSDIADIVRLPQIHSDLLVTDGGVLCISPRHIINRNELLLSRYDFVNSKDISATSLLQKDDIVMITTGSQDRIGNYYRYNLPMQAVILGNMLVIRPILSVMSADQLADIIDRNYYKIKLLATQPDNGTHPHSMPYKLRRQDLENLQI